MNRVFIATLLSAAALLAVPAHAAQPAPREPYGIGLEGFAYPYPVNMLPLVNDGEQVRMAYMDVAAAQPNGRTVVLLHGRNFPSSYWAPVIKTLTNAGYRVVVPDQIGFGKSSKPAGDLHFDTLARNTIVTAIAPHHPFTVLTRPTPIQQKAFDLLDLRIVCTQ